MLVRIEPGKLHGKVSAPPSKSYAQRLIIGAALSDGESVIKGISNSEDMGAALDCISALGAGYELSGDTVRISGRGVLSGESSRDLKSAISNRADGKEAGSAYRRNLKEEEENDNVVIFPCRESGNTLRFFIPISLCFFDRVRFSGSKRLIERGISVYEEIFEKKRLSFDIRETSIDIKGKLEGGEYRVRGDVSSQFITGLLFALPLLDKDSIIELIPPVESRAYIDITIDVLKSFSKNDTIDLLLIAVKPEYKGKGGNAIVINKLLRGCRDMGIKYAETGPTLELNNKVLSQWKYFDTEQHKRRRCFIKRI